MAAWAFGAAGLTAAQGVATAVVYGVLVLVASLPGSVLRSWLTAPEVLAWQRHRASEVHAMAERPYILLSCSMSIDGYLDGATDERLLLSNEADFDRVDAVRAGCDAILVGRRDRPPRQPAAAGAVAERGGRTGWPAGCARRRSR